MGADEYNKGRPWFWGKMSCAADAKLRRNVILSLVEGTEGRLSASFYKKKIEKHYVEGGKSPHG